jgi:DNA transposition AAA+ family ATPase
MTTTPYVDALPQQTDLYAACAGRLSDYLARTGLFVSDFAQRVGCDDAAIRSFLRGKYHKIARSMPEMVGALTEFMNTHPAGDSARVTGELYETANVRAIRATFQKLLPAPVAYVIYAPPGSQKSFVLEHEVAHLNHAATHQRAYYVNARKDIRPRDLMRRICIECGSRTANDIDPMLESLRYDFRSLRVLLVIDEAQFLSIDCLETIRELLDHSPYFSLLLAGSHDLRKKFDEFSATLEQWNSRIIDKVRLPGLERPEAVGIIHREIGELLEGRESGEVDRMIDGLIKGATVLDVFEGGRHYINVRTLTNALTQIKRAALQPKAEEVQ